MHSLKRPLAANLTPLMAPEAALGQAPDRGESWKGQTPASTARGRLLRVDYSAKTFEIRSGRDGHMLFYYTDQMRVPGTAEVADALGTMVGAQVLVQYSEQEGVKIASQIETQKKS